MTDKKPKTPVAYRVGHRGLTLKDESRVEPGDPYPGNPSKELVRQVLVVDASLTDDEATDLLAEYRASVIAENRKVRTNG